MKDTFDFKTVFYLDLRAIATARILFGILLLTDLFKRSLDLKLHYTDKGVLPIHFLVEAEWDQGFFSIHTVSGGIEWQVFLFLMHGFFALTLLVGYKTKFSVFVCWILLISLHNRNPLVLNSGDTYFRLLLFWSLFLPMGARYSIDSIKSSLKKISDKFYNVGTIAFIVQVMLIYLIGVLLKNSYEWLHDGTALYYALSLDQMVKPVGSWLLNFPELLRLLTFGTIAVEFIAPILFIIPFKNSLYRITGIILLISLHVGIELTLHVGIFSFVCMIALIGLLPSEVINRIENKVSLLTLHTVKKNQKKHDYSGLLKSKTVNVTAFLFLVYIFLWNINTLPKTPEMLPRIVKTPAHLFRLDQKWSMFAPTVLKADGWYIFEAELEDGRKVDLFQGLELTSNDYINNKPTYVFSHFKNARWRKYMEGLSRKESDEHYEYLIISFFKKWQNKNEIQINYVTLYFLSEYTLPMGEEISINLAKIITYP